MPAEGEAGTVEPVLPPAVGEMGHVHREDVQKDTGFEIVVPAFLPDLNQPVLVLVPVHVEVGAVGGTGVLQGRLQNRFPI